MSLTWVDLKEEVPDEVWQSVTLGEDTLGDRFLDRARVWLSARLIPCGVDSWDEDNDQIIRQALLYRAQYELYAFVEKEELAFDKRDAAEELLRAKFGRCIDNADKDQEISPQNPYIYVSEASNGWNGFNKQ